MSWQARIATPLGKTMFKRHPERDSVERMRTRKVVSSGQECSASARVAAATTASGALAKATKKPSPWVSTSIPPCSEKACRSKRWCSPNT
jgi:hypothetical protein